MIAVAEAGGDQVGPEAIRLHRRGLAAVEEQIERDRRQFVELASTEAMQDAVLQARRPTGELAPRALQIGLRVGTGQESTARRRVSGSGSRPQKPVNVATNSPGKTSAFS